MKFGSPEASQLNRQESYHGIDGSLAKKAYLQGGKMLIKEKKNIREANKFSESNQIYSQENIQKDLDKTKVLADKIEETRKGNELLHMVSLATEALIFEQVALSGWLSAKGVQVYVEKTSQFDDFFNKTDMVFTFVTEDDEEPLFITVDVTIGSISLKEKIHSIQEQINKGTLGYVKYHETLSGGYAPLEGVPRVLLGIEPEEINRLLKLWTDEEEGSKEKSKEALKKDPVQLLLVRQIEDQLISYQEYARSSGDTATAKKYDKIIAIIQRVRAEKENLPLSDGESENLFRFLGIVRRALQSQLIFPGSRVPEGIVGKNSGVQKHE